MIQQLHHLHAWSSSGQNRVLSGSRRSKLLWMTTCRGEHKTMTELHGKEAKEEDLKPFHQPHRLQSKSTQPARQTLRLGDI